MFVQSRTQGGLSHIKIGGSLDSEQTIYYATKTLIKKRKKKKDDKMTT